MAQHPHLFVPTAAESKRYTSPSSGPREAFNRPDRQRADHANALIGQIEDIRDEAEARAENQRQEGFDEGNGIYLSFESEPNFPLKFESLDMASAGIELCTVKALPDGRTQATLFIPDGKLGRFLKRIEAYRDENTTPRKEGGVSRPKNQDLVESVADIKLAALEALWMEDSIPFPDPDTLTSWEVWLRHSTEEVNHLERLRANAERFNLTLGKQYITFVDRVVILVRSTAKDLARSSDILGMIAELRAPKLGAAFFTDMTGIEQQEWIDNLSARLQPLPQSSPYVCLFDTGLNRHTLLTNIVQAADLHTYKPAWGMDDRSNHGTPMAGLASFGDLTEVLASGDPIACTHRLESVKIIHEPDPDDPDLYGAVTQESAYRVEVNGNRQRVFCMAVTATDGRDRGRPSSWSAAVDALASGADDGQYRLFVLSAGNTDATQRHLYPHSNMTDSVHDPAQSWNALTVGGCTDKATIDAARFPGWTPLAPIGDLSPCSCTSTTWSRWPFKPDIVMEAGNMGINPAETDPDYVDDNLSLLSTSAVANRPLIPMGDTSAAAALASRLCAVAWSKYPDLKPETVRALMVHSAWWTPQMRARFRDGAGEIDYKTILRCYGYGVPDQQHLLSSLDNSLTLIVEDEIRPFFEDNGAIKTREMRLHKLPWPKQALTDLPNTDVTMRVTLSYFVEPSPGARGWTPRYGYQSHGLRFAVINPLETPGDFQLRINRFEREDDYMNPNLADPGWTLGRSLRSSGSIHSDIWTGKAIELASREYIAVHPTMGWWNKRKHLEGWRKTARYSLVVTIATPEVEVPTKSAFPSSLNLDA